MKKISVALRSLIEPNGFLRFGLHHRLFNLSQLARHLKPQVEARVSKQIEESALVMNLSRLQRDFADPAAKDFENLRVSNIVVHSELCVLAYPKTKDVHAGINKLYNRVQREGGYITITEGISEVAIITNQKYHAIAGNLISTRPFYEYEDVASLGVKFNPEFLGTIGLFYSVFQQLYFQRINIIEIASAASELILYIENKDVRLAFDTLYNRLQHERGMETKR